LVYLVLLRTLPKKYTISATVSATPTSITAKLLFSYIWSTILHELKKKTASIERIILVIVFYFFKNLQNMDNVIITAIKFSKSII